MKLSNFYGLLFLALDVACLLFCNAAAMAEVLPGGSAASASDSLLAKGLADVTRYGAKPDDEIDDTAAIQKAIDDARDQRLVAYFPGGVYLVSDTLMAMQRVAFDTANRWTQDRRSANALIGASAGKKPTLKLMKGSKGFDDPGNPKPLVWIWSQAKDEGRQRGSTSPRDEQPNISFNQVFKGIDIDLRGPGNSGAVGIRHAGSQGSTLESVTIWAEGAYAGVVNPPGQGGGVYDLTINRGRFGVWADHQARYPVFGGLMLIEQDVAAIFWKGQSNLTIAGFVIEKSKPGPVVALQPGGRAHSRALTLVDGIIRGSGSSAIDNRAGRNLYIKDVYVSGSRSVVESRGRSAITIDGPLSRVIEYSYTGDDSRSIFGGQIRESGFEHVQLESVATTPLSDKLLERHLWGRPFPSFDDPDAISITNYGAHADDDVDDTDAIRTALSKHHKVLVPKGTFLVSDTVKLRSSNHLLGVAKHLSIIRASPHWKGVGRSPVLTTEDDAAAATTLSFLMIERPENMAAVPLLEWRAGRNSVVRDVIGGRSQVRGRGTGGHTGTDAVGTFSIRGQGGGRWYGLAAEWNRLSPDTGAAGYRHLAIEGTREPLAMYGVNIERGLSEPQFEIADARNVAIFYLKGESLSSEGGQAGVLTIRGSKNVAVFGYSGNARPWGSSVIRLVDSDDVVLANVMPVGPDEKFDTVRVEDKGQRLQINGKHPASVVRLGSPTLPF